ncbi:hypothetical protein RHGRI_022560 [Rhododendron griersonianum]|uniref:Uncharacterized protein n=1 Tax=Rhododendron griersonianum TaxID=479676 RepID=A0AAV6IZY7_9ERIC|nr:hypothetical protein RHGRI_022560 [Rhododendron griersonianum]
MEWSDIFAPATFASQFEVHHKYQDPAKWTFEENKAFESALAEVGLDSPAFFNHVASRVPSKSMDDIKRHYARLLQDVEMIEAGFFPMPRYVTPHDHHLDHVENNQGGGDEETRREKVGSSSKQVARKACSGNQRKRAIPWTEEEHRLFLMGLNKYGKGDWRSISRYYVVTKTPTQVASHAQKFFRRQTCTTPTDRRRPSIHDIQTVDSSIFPYPPQMNTNPIMTDELIPPQVPIPNPYGSLTPAMYNHHNNLHSNEGLMTNYGTEVGPGFPPGTSTFPIASSAINQPPSEIYLCSTSYPSPYPMNYP